MRAPTIAPSPCPCGPPLPLRDVAEQVERARHEHRLPQDMRTRECIERVVDDLDVLEVALREGSQPARRNRALGRRSCRDEPRSDSTKLSEYRVGVLVGENRYDDRVVEILASWLRATKSLDEKVNTVGIVRTVPDLALVALEAAGERDTRIGRDRVADERLRGVASTADPHLVAWDETRVAFVGKHDNTVL